jgi:hypothetical protein
LIVAGATVATHITDAGAGFTILDITHPNGDNAQQQITSVAGSCEATAPVAGGDWVIQSVAFKQPPPPDFTIVASMLSPATVLQGGSATSTVTVAPLGDFTGSVALTCSIAPVVTPPPRCSFNPTPVVGGSGTSTLTVSTTAATTASAVPPSKGIFYAMWLPISGLALLGTGCTSGRRKLLGLFLVCLMLSGLIFMAACGGGSSSGGGGGHRGTPVGSYTVTVTATAGSLTHTAPVTVVVH